MCRDLSSRTMQLVLLLLLSLTPSNSFKPAGLRGAEHRNRKLNSETPNSLLIRINQDTSRTFSGYSGTSTLAGYTGSGTATPMGLGSWIVSLDGSDVGIATPGSDFILTEDESSSFRLEGGTRVCIRPQYALANVDDKISQILKEFQANIGGYMWTGNGSTRSVQDYCYALGEGDFLNRNGSTNEAWVTFTLTPWGQATVTTPSAPLTPAASSLPPTGSPTSGGTLTGTADTNESNGDSETGPDFREGDNSTIPSLSPTASPSDSSSYFPSDSPSVVPSRQPSGAPSASPSDIPSYLPSDVPSAVPSRQPSGTPSASPSDSPSYVPSDVPSAVPSRQPSGTPSASPSDIPSYVPSDVPSAVPSRQPSGTPSASPSDIPSYLPSDIPSAVPSGTPSVYPSVAPSAVPTATPSAPPTLVPSQSPTKAPNASSTETPSSQPSAIPGSVGPTTDIRFRETESGSLSSYPTEMPSGKPSGRPSSTPTGVPSASLSPTGFPSSIPTMSPGPTFSPSPIPRYVVVRVVLDISASSTLADFAALATSSVMTEQQWLVTVDGVDAPRGMLTELVTDSVTATVSSGSQVCIQPVDAGELTRIQDNPGGQMQGIASMDPFAIVFTKDLCYTLRDADFESFGGEMFAEISFTL